MCGVGSLRKGPAVRAPDPGPAGLAGGEPGLRIRFGAGPDPAQLLPVLQPGQPVFGLFAQATAALSDGYIYLALTHSNSPAGEVIGLFTGRAYNHISLAFDRALKTLVSYNGGEGGEAPGLNPETLKGLAERKGASVRVYRLAATRHQKQIMLKRLRKINQEGSAYNLLGLLFPMSCQPNIMFCSQFVYAMLRLAGLHYFRKNPLQVRPTDFVEWDRRGRLAFVAEFTFDGVCLHCQDSIPQMRPTAG